MVECEFSTFFATDSLVNLRRFPAGELVDRNINVTERPTTNTQIFQWNGAETQPKQILMFSQIEMGMGEWNDKNEAQIFLFHLLCA